MKMEHILEIFLKHIQQMKIQQMKVLLVLFVPDVVHGIFMMKHHMKFLKKMILKMLVQIVIQNMKIHTMKMN